MSWRAILGLGFVGLVCLAATDETVAQSLLESVQKAVLRGDLAELDRLARADSTAKAEPAFAALALANGYFALGELEAALALHERAAASTSVREELQLAQLETTIDLMALGRFAEACQRASELPRELLASSPELEIAAIDLDLHCGRARQAMPRLEAIYRHHHSSAEEGLAHIFGEVHGFARRRASLESAARPALQGAESERALAELFLCGDFSDPFSPKWHFDEAASRFAALAAAAPQSCELAGRLATARLLSSWKPTRSAQAPGPDLRAFLEPTPRCVEVVEAELLGIRLRAAEAAHDQAIQLLEKATRAFPNDPRLAFVLIGERDALRKPDAELLATLVERFPSEWFPYARLSLEAPDTPAGRAEARALLERGLSRAPSSILLNLLLAVQLQREEKWDASVEPAALATAGLLETQSYHHGWAPGISLLNSALEKRAARLPDRQAMIDFVRSAADVAALDEGFTSAHGCFSDPQRAALRPLWYRPESVAEVLKLAESAGSRVPAAGNASEPE